jgi:hypothetical protein
MGKDLISRDALERIIKRAAELQAGERDIGEGLTTNEVLALGKDVGIPDRYLRQAMLDEQTRITPEVSTGTWAWLTGPRSIVAHRVVPGDRDTVEQALASEISAQVVQLEPGFCLVRLEADIRKQRASRITGATVMTVIGWGLTGATALIAPPLALAQALMLVPGVGLTIGGVMVARTYGGANERMQIALEQVLDRLERGEIRASQSLQGPNPFFRIADEVRKAFENPRPKRG